MERGAVKILNMWNPFRLPKWVINWEDAAMISEYSNFTNIKQGVKGNM